MKLAASLVVRNELGRYLEPCIEHLLEFCDIVVVQDDGSDDGTRRWLQDHDDERIALYANSTSTFFVHEGQTRQRLLVKTLAHEPTHVLNIDADEFVDAGTQLRAALKAEPDVPFWSLSIEEIRVMKQDHLLVREDGSWKTHDITCLWKVPDDIRRLKIMDRRLACRRVPTLVWQARGKAVGVSLLHFGWNNPSERKERAARYAQHDGGRFHANTHLKSILWGDDDPRMKLRSREWPSGSAFDSLRLRLADGVASAP